MTFELGLRTAIQTGGTVGVIIGDIGLPASLWRRWHFQPNDAALPPAYRQLVASFGASAPPVSTVSESGLREAAQRLITADARRRSDPATCFEQFGWAVVYRSSASCVCGPPQVSECLAVVDPDRDDGAPLLVGLRSVRTSDAGGVPKLAKIPLCSLLYAALVSENIAMGHDAHVALYGVDDPHIAAKLRGGAVISAALTGGEPSAFVHHHEITDPGTRSTRTQTWRHDQVLDIDRPDWLSFWARTERAYPDVRERL